MDLVGLRRLENAVSTPEMLERSVAYLCEQMKPFLRPADRILICFPSCEGPSVGNLLAEAARELGAVPILLEGDLRWKSMLMHAFHSRATVVAAPPFVVLGLTKLARHTKTPLFFRNVITAGYRCSDWMTEGIRKGLDCMPWRIFGPGSVLVGGFSCNQSLGFHLRTDMFRFEIVDEQDRPVEQGESGFIVMSPLHAPDVRYQSGERGRMITDRCSCGRITPRIVNLLSGPDVDPYHEQLGRDLLLWTSVLDCRFRMVEDQLEITLIVLPGGALPKLPEDAIHIVKVWEPEQDMPYWFYPDWRNTEENS